MEYPILPPNLKSKESEQIDEDLPLDKAASKALNLVDAIEQNRMKREALEGNQSLSDVDKSKTDDKEELKKSLQE